MKSDETFVKLRFNIQRNYPFFSALSRVCPFVIRNDLPYNTDAATDGKNIYFSDQFFKQKFDYQLLVAMHEVLHNAFKHSLRLGRVKHNGDRQLFNIVADLKVNTVLNKMGFYIPEDFVTSNSIRETLTNGGYKYNTDDIYYITDVTVSMEEAYDRIRRKQKYDDGNSWSKLDKIMSNDLMDNNLKEEEKREIEKQINNAIMDGIIAEKMRGNKEGFITKLFQSILPKNEVDWKTIVKNHIRTMLRGNRTWNKIHKKSLYLNQLLPGYKNKEKISAVIGIDVSGSINDKTYEKFIGEIIGLLIKHKCDIKIVEFDERIKSEVKVKNKKDFTGINKKRHGYGGTSYKALLDKYKNAKLKIIFTDGYGDQKELYGYRNVVWLTTAYIKDFNFGKVVKIKPE
jgi:predicted metal-dependent peptidase